MKQFTFDGICCDSSVWPVPLFNEKHLESLAKHQGFKMNIVLKTHISKQLDIGKLKNSKSDIIICLCPDQHNLGFNYEQIKSLGYKKIIWINDEPIFHYNSMGKQAHLNFLSNHQENFIYYCSNFDKLKSPTNCLKKTWNSGLNLFFPQKPEIKNKKFQAVLDASTTSSWAGRQSFFDAFSSIKDLPKILNIGESWDYTSDIISKSKIYIIPPHPLVIHWLRFSRALHLGALPVVFNYDGWMDDEDIRKSYPDIFSENNKTCLLANVSEFELIVKKLKNEDYVDSLIDNIYKKNLYEYSIEKTWDELYNDLLYLV
tara:strand:+ start:1170 stop:2114 length:945 start_codon:yes stop_codon:yes gene_type:complete